MKNIVFVLLLLLSLFVNSAYSAAKPTNWNENDWIKFIDEVVWGTLPDAYAAAGGRFPLTDVFWNLSMSGSAVKPRLQKLLKEKSTGAYKTGYNAAGDRYKAFLDCLTWSPCKELRKIENSSENDVWHLYRVCRSGYGCGDKCLTQDEVMVHRKRGESVRAKGTPCTKP